MDSRPSAARRGYGSRWQRERRSYLRQYPLCKFCEEAGRFVPSECVDHVVPHRGDWTLFWDVTNWQALCKPCHDKLKATAERGIGIVPGCDERGIPLDASHPWRASGGQGRK